MDEDSIGAVAEEWRALVAWALAHRAADLATLEAGLLVRGHAVLRGWLAAALAAAPAAGLPPGPVCPACDRPAQRLGVRPKTLHLTLGDATVTRACGYCPACRATWAPLDAQLGVDQSGRSPRLVEVLALLGTELPFAAAADRHAHLCGVRVGASQVQAVTEATGRARAAQQQAEAARVFAAGAGTAALPPVERAAPWVVVTLDGVLVPHRDGCHEVRTGAVAALRPQDLGGAYPLPWRYVIHPGDVPTFGRLLWLEAHRQGLGQAERVVVLGDGAHWIWNLAEEHFPDAVHIVDLWHAVEHLWAAGRALLGDHDPQAAAWVARATARLKAGEVRDLLAEWAVCVPKQPDLFAAECTYFRNQAPRMAYDQYAAAGYPLGSGAVESANRHVVGARTKQAGMHWTAPGVAGVLALRALLRSARWAAWWEDQPPPLTLAA